MVLSRGHVICISGVNCVTLGHGFLDANVQHSYYGTQAVVEDLQQYVGWADGFIDKRESPCVCGEIRRETGEGQHERWLEDVASEGMMVDSFLLLHVHAAAMGSTWIPCRFRYVALTLSDQFHVPPMPESVPKLVDHFCVQTMKMINEKLNPLVIGAFCLWWVNAVHPFEDGNGRAARGMAFALSMMSASPDSVAGTSKGLHALFREKKHRARYITGLQEANAACGQCSCCGSGSPVAFSEQSAPTLVSLWSSIMSGGC
eukprot:TRINITY_DN19261_c0_g1_i2.p1 TRINITY_DN19261_c0_g1~~TRINITY_DN19261_c0_g1_i2.p1  ORF type:complete len:303 (-),score=36.38 TRINITY_DN19261_c0_g1_i2:79-855(-)